METSHFNLILPRESPSANTLDRLAGPESDMQKEILSRHVTHRILKETEAMKTADAFRLVTIQSSYEHDFDKILRREQTFKIGG